MLNMPTLCLLGEEGLPLHCWEIGEEPLVIGRDDLDAFQLEDESLSRRHFMVVRDGEDCFIQDLDSQNGTWVDGRRANDARLRHHDCILAGRTLFVFSEGPVQMRVRPVIKPRSAFSDTSPLPAGA
jgi:pSer/pThr/pTyr-binding forkhead associated (FHA) protein